MSTTDLSRNSGSINSPDSLSPPENQPLEIDIVDSDFVVILAALLCGLICVIGLAAVARCAWIRRIAGGNSDDDPLPPANKGLKKKVLKSLPKFSYTPERSVQFSECAICLMEFVIGDEIRVLPQCGHGFHVGCIDTWLGSHSSCPSCRQIPVVSRCSMCGELPVTNSSAAVGGETGNRSAPNNNYHVNAFLP
ncbi:RING-H2 finger protein ATL8-like [Solanum tuberosum]|uniref:RING-H2 finger protein ATL80 n=1 Tax=Solanum tuberosum TaxID=4113 RepID=M1CVG7_SOLTU|nr:PREDICTED: RING-H2 finger protein ATL8-like [Solanum tuberosum]